MKSNAPGLQLYALRHAWAVRSIRQGVPTGLAAKCMGHDVAIHCRSYHRWLDAADVAAAAARLAAGTAGNGNGTTSTEAEEALAAAG